MDGAYRLKGTFSVSSLTGKTGLLVVGSGEYRQTVVSIPIQTEVAINICACIHFFETSSERLPFSALYSAHVVNICPLAACKKRKRSKNN